MFRQLVVQNVKNARLKVSMPDVISRNFFKITVKIVFDGFFWRIL